jgi:hypothetical protein
MLRIFFWSATKVTERLNNMRGMLTRIKYIYPVWLAIKWLLIFTLVLRSGGCGTGYDGVMQTTLLGDGWLCIARPHVDRVDFTDCTVPVTPDLLVRTI